MRWYCGSHFENHLVFIGRLIDQRHLPVAVGAHQRVLNLLRRDAERQRAIAIDVDHHLRAGDLQIAVHVDKAGQRGHRLHQRGVHA